MGKHSESFLNAKWVPTINLDIWGAMVRQLHTLAHQYYLLCNKNAKN